MKEVLFISCFSFFPSPSSKKTKKQCFSVLEISEAGSRGNKSQIYSRRVCISLFPLYLHVLFPQLVINSGFKHRLERLLSLICYSELIETHWIWFQFLVFNLFFNSFCTTGILSSKKPDSLERDSPQVTLRYFKDKITDFYRLAKHPWTHVISPLIKQHFISCCNEIWNWMKLWGVWPDLVLHINIVLFITPRYFCCQ